MGRRITLWAILLVAILSLCISSSAYALAYEETFTESTSIEQTVTRLTSYSSSSCPAISAIKFVNVQNYQNIEYLAYWDISWADTTKSPITTDFTIYDGAEIVATGSAGVFAYTTSPTTKYQYWMDFDSGITTSKTGTQIFTIVYESNPTKGTSSYPSTVSYSDYTFGDVDLLPGVAYGNGGLFATKLIITSVLWTNSIGFTAEDKISTCEFTRDGQISTLVIPDLSIINTGSTSTTFSFMQPDTLSFGIKSPSGTWYNRSVLGSSGAPSASIFGLSLSLSPTSAAVGDPVTATLTPAADAPAYDMVEWTIADDWRPYRLAGSTWYAYNATTETYADAVTEAAVLSQTCQFAQEGNGPVFCRVYDFANGTLLADLKEYVTVSGTSAYKFPLYVAVFDADSGATLMSTTCQITNLDTAAVSTTTIQTSHAGETFLLDSSDRYQIVVSKAGYESRTWSNIRSDTSSLTAYLPKTAGGPTDIYIYFSVHDTGGAPVQNALVSLTGLTPTLTNAQGSVKLLAATNTTYTYSVSADGYIGATDSLETSATSLWYECTLTPTGGVATATTTATVPGGSSENLDDTMAVWTDNLQLIAALLFMAFIIGILKLMV